MPLSRFISARFPSLARVFIPGLLLLALGACGGGGGGNGLQGGVVIPPPPDPALNVGPRIGNGTGTSFVNGIIAANQTTVDAGQRAQLRVNVVNGAGQAVDGTVTFTSTCATAVRATISPVTIVGTGLYQVDYTNINCDGPDIVTATLAASGTSPSATAKVTLTTIGPQALTVSFVSTSFDQLSLAGIGGNESAELVFRVAGPQGVPVIGKQVTFGINTAAGGASILPSRATGITDQNGNVSTVLLSGTVAGTVNVLATHAESGRRGLSNDIIISTGVPQASRFSLSYAPQNPVAANDTDGVTVSLSIIASDAFGNNPTDGTRISFVSPESGNIQNSCLLADGACTVTWRSSAPRPADMRATVIAFTDGAENFVDRNGNSVFDAADGAVSDLGEPYADENEDGIYQLGEYFFDTDRDGVRDIGNTLWDGPCLVKVNTAAICTGNSTATIYATATIVMANDNATIHQLGTFPTPGTTIAMTQGTTRAFAGMLLSDSNVAAKTVGGNPLPVGTTVTFAIEGAGATLLGVPSSTLQNTTAPTGPYGITVRAATIAAGGVVPTGVRLLLNVQVPGVALQQFAWPLDITL